MRVWRRLSSLLHGESAYFQASLRTTTHHTCSLCLAFLSRAQSGRADLQRHQDPPDRLASLRSQRIDQPRSRQTVRRGRQQAVQLELWGMLLSAIWSIQFERGYLLDQAVPQCWTVRLAVDGGRGTRDGGRTIGWRCAHTRSQGDRRGAVASGTDEVNPSDLIRSLWFSD